jgi:hypothetical protein
MLEVLLHATWLVWQPRMLRACCFEMCWNNSVQSTGSLPHVRLAAAEASAAGVCLLCLLVRCEGWYYVYVKKKKRGYTVCSSGYAATDTS